MDQYLFDVAPGLPEGFQYTEDFISPEEEKKLCGIIAGIQLHTFKFQGFEAKRRVASFGYDYHFDQRALEKGESIPAVFQPLMARVARYLSIPERDIAELLITEYPPGAVINWHRDAPPFGLIAGISLASDCKFRLRPHDPKLQGRKSIISVPVKRRSLYVMQGSAREAWQHSIAAVKQLRYSITLRTLLR